MNDRFIKIEAYACMETESQQSVIFKPGDRKANHIIDLRPRKVNDVDSSLNWKDRNQEYQEQEKARMPQLKQSGRKKVIPPSFSTTPIQT